MDATGNTQSYKTTPAIEDTVKKVKKLFFLGLHSGNLYNGFLFVHRYIFGKKWYRKYKKKKEKEFWVLIPV